MTPGSSERRLRPRRLVFPASVKRWGCAFRRRSSSASRSPLRRCGAHGLWIRMRLPECIAILCLDITPPGLQPMESFEECAPIAQLRPTCPPVLLQDRAPDWPVARDPSRPLVYMTLGTNTNSDHRPFRAVIDGLGDLPLDVL